MLPTPFRDFPKENGAELLQIGWGKLEVGGEN
jgi:hypothetical protein